VPTTTANLPNLLTRTYNRERYFAPHERVMTKFLDGVEDFADGGKPLGTERRFAIRTADSHATGGTAEMGDLPAFSPPQVLQAAVTAIQVSASCSWSELMLLVATGEGTLGEDIIDDHVKMTTRNLMTQLNFLTLGHGTGRLAVVESSTTTLTTFVVRNPEGVLQLRKGQLIDFFDLDTGGSKQGASQTIVSINFETRTVTIDASRSLTAGWGIYRALSTSVSSYGIAPFGLRGICDNGALTATQFGITRSASPDINATVLNAGGGRQSYSEKLLRKGCNRIFYQTGLEPDAIWMNEGVRSEHLNALTGSRVYNVTGNEVPGYRTGNKMQLGHEYNGKFIPFTVEGDLPANELYILTTNLFRRHILRKANWVGDGVGPEGSGSAVLMQMPGSAGQTYALGKVAGQLWVGNIAHLQPKANTAEKEIFDEELAGDV
jgi:hypothetical protein